MSVLRGQRLSCFAPPIGLRHGQFHRRAATIALRKVFFSGGGGDFIQFALDELLDDVVRKTLVHRIHVDSLAYLVSSFHPATISRTRWLSRFMIRHRAT